MSENKSVWIFLLVVILLDTAVLYGAYKFGRYTMKRDMTPAITENIEGAYYDGRKDGLEDGRKEGYQEGLKAALAEEDERGR